VEILSAANEEIREGDLLVQFTDGVTKPMNDRNEEFGMKHLVELLQEGTEKDVDYISYRLEKAPASFRGKTEQQDDIALLAFRYRG
jgi:serine phosphatase RsbU (regulator of sigma subunit)